MALTFYWAPMSSAVRIEWALEELGIPYEKVRVALRGGAEAKADLLKVNPHGKVPAIVDGDTKVFESAAILMHLGERYGIEKGLWPAAGTKERSEAYAWTVWGMTEFVAAVRTAVFYDPASEYPHGPPREARSQAIADIARREIAQQLTTLDAWLTRREVLVGATFTFADLSCAANVNFAERAAGVAMSAYPTVAAWLDRARTRPAFVRVAERQ